MEKPHILVVEDESVVALDIQNRLVNLGYDVPVIVSNGEEAIRKVETICPDLVLMDIKLKGEMDGVEAAEHIRTHFEVPVIYLTAYTDGPTLQRAKIAEPFGYLLKPVKERELHTTIEMALYKHRMERRLKESERRLATTLNSIGDAVISTDAQGRIQFMNPLAETLTGWKQEQAIGEELGNVFRVVDRDKQNATVTLVVKVLKTGLVIHLEENISLIAKDGTETPTDASVAPIKDDKGNISGVVLVFRDVTERLQAQDALRKHATELKAQNEELDAFAHTVAHDLKNPLNLVTGFAEVLRTDYTFMPHEELEKHLAVIANNGRKMSNIIDELLLLAGVRQMKVAPEPLDMGCIVAEARERLAYMVDTYEAEITVPAQWPVALGYAPWIEEVWVNYISNGIKYGGQPPRLKLGAILQQDGRVRFWIRDNGPGLTLEEQARLFTPFTQLNRVRANGHGLGLSIVQRIVSKLNGEVGLISQRGHGSIFTFTLPGMNDQTDTEVARQN